MQNDEGLQYRLISDFEAEYIAYMRALPENVQCMIAQLTASQLKGRKCRPLDAYVELKLVK